MSTIYDVAALAGVSPATVSRVLNGIPVSLDRAQRVRDAAEALSFTPNRTARTMRNRHSEIIALVIPDIENPFFTAIARGVEDVAQSAGFSVVLCNTDDDAEKEARYLSIAVSENMAGVILAPAGPSVDLSRLQRLDRPIVAVDRVPLGWHIDSVVLDSAAGGRDATEALYAQGFRRIACISGSPSVPNSAERADGWREVVHRHGDDNETYLRHSNSRVEGGRAAMRELLSLASPPDAVFVANNLMGVGALQALADAELTPKDVGVAVFGDLPSSVRPPADVIVIPQQTRRLGESAATLLLERIDGDTEPARTIVLPSVPREPHAESV
ncbi:MAG: Transcriptional regulator, LacI family [Microbacteriaceae bacterium]|jgi:LacI family transcriptional regulator|nr:Transcriptional regulator, LacI family [Microbacteriaceae bacterium]